LKNFLGSYHSVLIIFFGHFAGNEYRGRKKIRVRKKPKKYLFLQKKNQKFFIFAYYIRKLLYFKGKNRLSVDF